MTKLESFITKDGSSSLYHPELDETYHSRHGALQEAMHVFIDAGLSYRIKQGDLDKVSVFEMGFGTGLNCLLSAIWGKQHAVCIDYTGIENTVLSAEQLKNCNYSELIPNSAALFEQIHASKWNELHVLNESFSLTKQEISLEALNTSNRFDVVYYDAFGPRVQPHLWEISALKIMHNLLKPKGVFVTYCAKGAVRRNLIELGCTVERLPGPPGKREMLRATKID